jgi:predicted  nucleic acid-binding Zn-ribbon protein
MNNLLRRIDRTLVFERLISTFPEPQAEVLTEAISLAVEQVWGDVATKTDVDELKEALHRLAEAQARTDESVRALAKAQARTERRVEELAEAQRRTEEEFQRYREASEARFARIEAALDRLAEAQARTEEEFRRYREASEARFARIEAALDRLAEAQARTEEEFRRYREASEARFARIEAALDRLAEAQARTERKVDQLARQVGGLSETIGGDLEDIAYIVIHKVLGRELGWKVGELKRVWQKWDGQLREVNIFGEAHDPQRPSQRIWIVGEAKHNLTMREVERFARTVEMARRNLEGEIFPVCFCYRARPEVQERIRELGFRLVFSYGELV